MNIRNAVLQMANRDPSFQKGIDVIEKQLATTPMVPEDLDEAIALLEFVIQNPDKYQEVRAAAIKDGIVDESMIPAQYDQNFVVAMLVALYGLQDRLNKKMARGGLAMASRKMMTGGQGGDTELVHVNRREKEMLRRMGGSGDINPNTGLHEYKSGKKIIGTILPVAAAIFMPFLAPAIGTALGASGIGASIIGGAVVGGASSALTGGNVAQGALLGGLGGGLGSAVGGAASRALGMNLGAGAQNVLGSALVGAGAGELSGQGALKGALQGVAGGALGELAGKLNAGSAFSSGLQSAGRTAGQALTAGYDPQTAAQMGALSGVMSGMRYKPSDQVVDQMGSDSMAPEMPDYTKSIADLSNQAYEESLPQLKGAFSGMQAPETVATTVTPEGATQAVTEQAAAPTYPDYTAEAAAPTPAATPTNDFAYEPQTAVPYYNNPLAYDPSAAYRQTPPQPNWWQRVKQAATGQAPAAAGAKAAAQPAQPQPLSQKVWDYTKSGIGLSLLAGAGRGGQDQPQTEAPVTQSAAQQEYFNRPSIALDWSRLRKDAALENLTVDQYMARNMNLISSGYYNASASSNPYGFGTAKKAQGGLTAVARYARGSGSGRDDTINARLSDGEYVMDAETVALLGDGSSEEGARRLDKMREQLRKQKGKALAKGKFSPNAKSPLNYIKGVA